MKIISGEKLQFLCDHFLGLRNQFNFNPNIRPFSSKFVFLEDLNENNLLDNKKIVFCYSENLKNLIFLKNKLSFLKNDFILILHNSDENFNENCLELLENSKLKKIYTQNMNLLHSQVFPLPIGQANKMWVHGNESVLNENIKNLNQNSKTNFVYFNFNVSTNYSARSYCFEIISKKGIPKVRNLPYPEYLKLLSTYQFAICPVGNGIDCHRFWECLYLKVIPICLKMPLTEYYSKIFPVILLDKWEDLNVLNLNYENYQFKNYYPELDLKYYQDLFF
jgi:hypothetical protein